jgi:hypothetical protein
MLDVRRAKSSHFQTSHKIFMLREAWHGIAFLCVCKDLQQGCFRSARPFGMLLPKFQWEQGFSNWAALPAQWRVNVIPSSAASASRQEIPDIPRPKGFALTADPASTAAPEGWAASTAAPKCQSASTAVSVPSSFATFSAAQEF